jgi:hypothetical protein
MDIIQRNFASKIIKKTSYLFATLLIIILPLGAPIYASADATCTPPASGTGVHKPVGADASLYTYDCDSGLWVSSHYSYNPATQTYTALDPVVYTYDSSTGLYNYTIWQYDAPINDYQQLSQSIVTPPAGATVVGAPVPPTPSGSSSGTGSGSSQSGDSGSDSGDTSVDSVGDTGTGSLNGVNSNDSNTSTDDNGTTLTVGNTLTQTADSGDASILDNTNSGNASSGDASDIANVMNLLQSTDSNLAGNAVTFVSNINGDVDGNLIFDPSQLANVQPSDASATTNDTTTINNTTDASIDNNLNLDANSGNATVADNTNGGNATTGSADAIANVVNMIDSAVTSGQSFLGVININGNLNGNIEVPSDFVNQMMAANVPTVDIAENTGSTNNVTNTNNEGITNNVNSTAASGSATVADNTNGGSSTTGSANTDITAFNLTGSSVVGANDLLVFVNVVGGSWVGLIVNAPAGSTAAEMGGGITSDTTDNTTDTNTNNLGITNNINEDSQSGNADVADNTNGGNATSGNANNAVNLLNVEHSSLAMSNWFGILFINVFGTWNGDFGTTSDFASTSSSSPSSPGSMVATPLASFVAKTKGRITAPTKTMSYLDASSSGSGRSSSSSSAMPANAVLASSTSSSFKDPSAPQVKLAKTGHTEWPIIAGSIILFTSYIVAERHFSSKRSFKR